MTNPKFVRAVNRAIGHISNGRREEARREIAEVPPQEAEALLWQVHDKHKGSREHVAVVLELMGQPVTAEESTSGLARPDAGQDAQGVEQPAPRRIAFHQPEALLSWLADEPTEIDFREIYLAEIWGLVALAVLAREDGQSPIQVHLDRSSPAARFAYAVGFPEALCCTGAVEPGEEGRTVKLQRVSKFEEIEPVASKVSHLLVSDDEHKDTRRTIYYVLVELLRNVVQHSRDPLGGVVAAQLNDKGPYLERPMVQVTVGDAGIGIPKSLRRRHPQAAEPNAALQRSLWPHMSGEFDEGLTGTAQNAGMGLFFISEMAKRTGGRLLLASRGAALELVGDPTGGTDDRIRTVSNGYPGTLVGFELALDGVEDHKGLLDVISKAAQERTPKRDVQRWLQYVENSPEGATVILVRIGSENTVKAQELAGKMKRFLFANEPVTLDFGGLDIATQSFIHALLFEPLRLAWAVRTPIYAINVAPAVRSALELLESYAQGG